MAQDIKDLLKKEQLHIQKGLSDGHEARFLERLEAELPQEEEKVTKRSFVFYKIAAAVVLLCFFLVLVVVVVVLTIDAQFNKNACNAPLCP